jgi:hypothetical protein
MWLMSLTKQLATLGDPKADDKIVTKYLRVTRLRYQQLVVSIETLLDISTLLVEEVTTRLKAVKNDGVTISNRDGGKKLYLTEEEWLEHFKQKKSDGDRCSGGSSSGDSSDGSSGSRGKKPGVKKGSTNSNSNREHAWPPSHGKDKCRACGKIGHWARECQSWPKSEEQAHVAEDDMHTLMLAYTKDIPIQN